KNAGAVTTFIDISERKALAGHHDLVLMDIQMPEMDGYTATQKLRGAGYRKPVIALTAHAMDEVRKKCLDIGFNDHLSKPIEPKKLIQAVLKHTSH
ncbi:MAG: response regulator, partial [Bdellovibrionaceae bacterium]|nr:response regulator [Bdellovibrio sp.]